MVYRSEKIPWMAKKLDTSNNIAAQFIKMADDCNQAIRYNKQEKVPMYSTLPDRWWLSRKGFHPNAGGFSLEISCD